MFNLEVSLQLLQLGVWVVAQDLFLLAGMWHLKVLSLEVVGICCCGYLSCLLSGCYFFMKAEQILQTACDLNGGTVM